MYWQVYLHKTVLSAEFLLAKIISRARQLLSSGEEIIVTPAMEVFLTNIIIGLNQLSQIEYLNSFALLDDHDIFSCIKSWVNHKDPVIAKLCFMLINRKLPKVKIIIPPLVKK